MKNKIRSIWKGLGRDETIARNFVSPPSTHPSLISDVFLTRAENEKLFRTTKGNRAWFCFAKSNRGDIAERTAGITQHRHAHAIAMNTRAQIIMFQPVTAPSHPLVSETALPLSLSFSHDTRAAEIRPLATSENTSR